MNDLRKRFIDDLEKPYEKPLVLVTAVELPTGAIETAENREYLLAKLQYIKNAYDDNMRLKANPEVRMVGYMLVVQP